MTKRSPTLGFILGGVALWTILVTLLHITINGRIPLGAGAAALRTLQVGGLPVT